MCRAARLTFAARFRLFQFDGDSVGRLVGGILFGVRRRAGHSHIVRLRVGLIVQVHDDAIEDVLVRLPFSFGP